MFYIYLFNNKELNMKNIAVIGSSGAIGYSFVNKLSELNSLEKIYAFSRSNLKFDLPNVISNTIDVTKEDSIIKAISIIPEDIKLDLVIVATGILHDTYIQPEKSLRDLSKDNFEKIFAVNTIGPALLMKYFIPIMNKEHKSIFAVLSAHAGSITDNKLGGWYSYRVSKSALNMLIKNLSIEVGRRNKNSIIVGLDPGSVDSKLLEPFKKYMNPNSILTADSSTLKLLEVLNELEITDSGNCYDYNGSVVLP